jgi:hypothetical protein
MISLDEAIYEVEWRTSRIQFEVEQDRLARLAAASRSRDRVSRARRMAVQLADYVAGFRCLVQSRFATELGATAC